MRTKLRYSRLGCHHPVIYSLPLAATCSKDILEGKLALGRPLSVIRRFGSALEGKSGTPMVGIYVTQ